MKYIENDHSNKIYDWMSETFNNIDNLDSQHLLDIFKRLSASRITHNAFVKKLFTSTLNKLNDFSYEDLVSILHSIHSFYEIKTTEEITFIQNIINKLIQYPCNNNRLLIDVMWSLSKIKFYPQIDLVNFFKSKIKENYIINNLDVIYLNKFIQSIASLRILDENFIEEFLTSIAKYTLDLRQNINIAFYLSEIIAINEKDIIIGDQLISQIKNWIQDFISNLSINGLHLDQTLMKQLSALHASRIFQFTDAVTKKLIRFSNNYENSALIEISHRQEQVIKYLETTYSQSNFLFSAEYHFLELNIFADLVMIIRNDNEEEMFKIAIEVDGPSHNYVNKPKIINTPTIHRNYLYEQNDIKLITVSYIDINNKNYHQALLCQINQYIEEFKAANPNSWKPKKQTNNPQVLQNPVTFTKQPKTKKNKPKKKKKDKDDAVFLEFKTERDPKIDAYHQLNEDYKEITKSKKELGVARLLKRVIENKDVEGAKTFFSYHLNFNSLSLNLQDYNIITENLVNVGFTTAREIKNSQPYIKMYILFLENGYKEQSFSINHMKAIIASFIDNDFHSFKKLIELFLSASEITDLNKNKLMLYLLAACIHEQNIKIATFLIENSDLNTELNHQCLNNFIIFIDHIIKEYRYSGYTLGSLWDQILYRSYETDRNMYMGFNENSLNNDKNQDIYFAGQVKGLYSLISYMSKDKINPFIETINEILKTQFTAESLFNDKEILKESIRRQPQPQCGTIDKVEKLLREAHDKCGDKSEKCSSIVDNYNYNQRKYSNFLYFALQRYDSNDFIKKIIPMLIEYESNPHMLSSFGLTAFMLAFFKKSEETVLAIMLHSQERLELSYDDESIIDLAIKQNFDKVLRFLIQTKEDLMTEQDKAKILYYALINENFDFAYYLIEDIGVPIGSLSTINEDVNQLMDKYSKYCYNINRKLPNCESDIVKKSSGKMKTIFINQNTKEFTDTLSGEDVRLNRFSTRVTISEEDWENILNLATIIGETYSIRTIDGEVNGMRNIYQLLSLDFLINNYNSNEETDSQNNMMTITNQKQTKKVYINKDTLFVTDVRSDEELNSNTLITMEVPLELWQRVQTLPQGVTIVQEEIILAEGTIVRNLYHSEELLQPLEGYENHHIISSAPNYNNTDHYQDQIFVVGATYHSTELLPYQDNSF